VPSPRSGVAVIALSSFFFASMAVLTRTLAGRIPAAELVVVRHTVGVTVMAAWFAVRFQPPKLTRPFLLLLRGVLGGAAVLTYFLAIERLGAAPATVLNYLSPVYAAVWARLFLGERPPGSLWTGLVLATVGAALVTLGSADPSAGTASVFGAVMGIVSGVFGGAAMTTVKAARGDADAATVFGAFSVVGLALAIPSAASGWVPLTGTLLLTSLGVAALALVGQLLFTFGMGFTTATAGSATTQLVPVLAWALSIGLVGERVSPLAAAGAACCVGGVLLGMRPGRGPSEETRRGGGDV
jgi:drug/metabolite transporter (DMT)-like permease